MAVAGTAVVVAAVSTVEAEAGVSMAEVEVVGSTAAEASMVAEAGVTPISVVADVLTAAQAERHRDHFQVQGRELVGIAPTARGRTVRMAVDLRQYRLRARGLARHRAVLARLRRRATRATLELQVTVGLGPQLRGIVRLRRPLHFLEIQDRRLAEPVRL